MRNLLVVLLLLLVACGESNTSVPHSRESAAATASRESIPHDASVPQSPDTDIATPRAESIPPDVQITVLDESIIPGTKRSLDIRISRRVTEPELRTIAEALKAEDPNRYDRTFIVYYLPGMEPGTFGWATSHFDPELEIRILGTTSKQDETLAASSPPASSEDVIGVWMGDAPFLPPRITLYREDGRTMMLRTYSDGSGIPIEVTETETSEGTQYQWGSGDYVLVTSTGSLELRDAEGVIASYRPLD